MASHADVAASVGFPPIAEKHARILILGSLPSQASLRIRQYYAHPQNAFWKIMCELTGAEGSYAARCEVLARAGIAVWDVLSSSVRPGSMDADIQMASAAANDFVAFFETHDRIRLVCFNGKKAEQLFNRFVQPLTTTDNMMFAVLPSTSPAYASMSYAQKLQAWRGIITREVEQG
jgi:hypoxanthine-DNA glycosylase